MVTLIFNCTNAVRSQRKQQFPYSILVHQYLQQVMSPLRALQAISTVALIAASATMSSAHLIQHSSSLHSSFKVRGGGMDRVTKKKSKASKKSPRVHEDAKDVINEKMKESDVATAMGDAIR